MRRLKNTKILAAILSTALILANTGVYTLADVDEQTEEGGADSVENGEGSVDESEAGAKSGSNSGSEDTTDTGSGNNDNSASESSSDSDSSTDQTGASPDETTDEYDSPAAENVEEITDDTDQNSGNGSEGSQAEESFGELVCENDAVFDEEISEELLTTQTQTQTDNKKKSDDSTEEIPVSEETVSYSVKFTDPVTFDEDDNATFTFTVRSGSNPIKINSVNLGLYPGDSDISYDPVSREIESHDITGYNFKSSTEDIVNTEEEKTFTVTVPATAKDRNGSGETLSEALSEGDTVLSADIGMIIYDPEDYSEIGKETKSYFIGDHKETVDEGSEDTEEEHKVIHANYRIRTVKYDGEAHEMAFPRKVRSGRKILYSADLTEWTETPFSYTEEGKYECYYRMIDEETGDICRSGSLRMKIRKIAEKSVKTEENETAEENETTEENDRTELADMFKETGDTEVTGSASKLETFLDAEGVSNLSGIASKAYQSEITREHTSFPAVWSWMMVFFMIISFAVFSVTHDIWAGLYKAVVRVCAYAIVVFRRFRKALV